MFIVTAMKFSSGPRLPQPSARYRNFDGFKDDYLLGGKLTLPTGSKALYVQSFPDIYPGDVPLGGDAQSTVTADYKKFAANFQNTARLLVVPGQTGQKDPLLDWQKRVFAGVEEDVRVARLGDIALKLRVWAGPANQLSNAYFEGIENGVPKVGFWDVLPPGGIEQSNIEPLALGLMSYNKDAESSEISFGGIDVYEPEFDSKLLRFEQAWRNIFTHASTPLLES